jgi:hydroxymethylpyrimidine pyrophosphatase-like HAD family hydrolase
MQHQWDRDAIKSLARKIPDLLLQQLPHTRRVSFTTTRDESVQLLRDALDANHLAYTLVHSADRYVDVLPHGSGKGAAVTYVIKEYFGQPAEVLIAGDSGNDTAMLSLGYPAVIVGNAHPELASLRNQEHVYQAKAGHAAGIIEGWKHFYLLPIDQQRKKITQNR